MNKYTVRASLHVRSPRLQHELRFNTPHNNTHLKFWHLLFQKKQLILQTFVWWRSWQKLAPVQTKHRTHSRPPCCVLKTIHAKTRPRPKPASGPGNEVEYARSSCPGLPANWCINWVLMRVTDAVRETIADVSGASPLSFPLTKG